jgi:hypothetical protein
VSRVWIKREPYDVAGVGNVAAGYHTSSPTGPSQLTSR